MKNIAVVKGLLGAALGVLLFAPVSPAQDSTSQDHQAEGASQDQANGNTSNRQDQESKNGKERGKRDDKRGQRNEPGTRANLIREVRHQLVLLPYYSVFDNLGFRVEGDTVILEGQVVRPTLKSDAEGVVKNIEDVGRVVNNIEVLPLSSMDDQIRRAVYRTIFGDAGLSRYAESAVPSIHIIVKNGHVTLEGVVDSEGDKNLVNIRTNGVPNVFSVKNNLVVTPAK